MKKDFKIATQIVGFCAAYAEPGEKAALLVKEVVSSCTGALFLSRIEALHQSIFRGIPNLPNPATIDHLLVVIRPNWEATAYIDELNQVGLIKPQRDIKPGENVYESDFEGLVSLDIGVEIAADCGFVFVRSHRWQRSLYYDFGPLADPAKPRSYDLKVEFARQALSLLQYGRPFIASVDVMRGALQELAHLLNSECKDEARYQELLSRNPWLLEAQHSRIDRHKKFDDKNIPDFTATRHRDECHDIIEVKQPFLELFRADGNFSAEFNDSWNQAERYYLFAKDNRDFLLREKGLRFENPRCLLLAGYKLNEDQLKAVRQKESLFPAITVLTYESLMKIGDALLALAIKAGA
jgi:hypothetical protein